MRRLLLLVLVASLSEAVPGIPIYCRRFKGNCKRSTSNCCKYLNESGSISSTTTTSTTTTTTTAAYEEEYVDELEASDGDPLDAQPSYVEEVFVKPTLEELNRESASEKSAHEWARCVLSSIFSPFIILSRADILVTGII